MKYLIIVYSKFNDGKADKKAMYDTDDQIVAFASFHSNMSQLMNDKTVSLGTVMVIDEMGTVYKTESFGRPEEVLEEITE